MLSGLIFSGWEFLTLALNAMSNKHGWYKSSIFSDMMMAAFGLAFTVLLESFHFYCLLNVKQGQKMLTSAVSAKPNVADVTSEKANLSMDSTHYVYV